MKKYVVKYKLFDYESVGNLEDRCCIISTCIECHIIVFLHKILFISSAIIT